MSNIEYRESEPFTHAASGPLTAWRRHWVLGLVLALIGAALGAAAGYALPVTYTAEARVAVGSGDLTSGALAGFPLAASQLASNYARYVNDRGVAQTDVPDNVTLSASQIPESNVIRIEAESSVPQAAVDTANSAANQLVSAVNTTGKQSAQDALDLYTKAATADAAAQTELAAAQHDLDVLLGNDASKSAIRDARAVVTDATSKAAITSAQSAALRQKYTNLVAGSTTSANLLVIRTADSLESNRVSLISRLGLVGLVLGAGIGLLIAAARERRRLGAAGAPRKATEQPEG